MSTPTGCMQIYVHTNMLGSVCMSPHIHANACQLRCKIRLESVNGANRQARKVFHSKQHVEHKFLCVFNTDLCV
eukprot:m.162477 g.162477  ORF g.162477 m.162477 type:complete len:74 (+) comp18070_c0_seq2:1032-1253(+)